jgi:nicotinamide mononucleotide adenylyltransferase
MTHTPTYILPGRWQPPHRDHLAILWRAITRCAEPIHLALLVDGMSDSSVDPVFTHEADEHHSPTRNPFTWPQRVELLEQVIQTLPERTRQRVRMVPMPRPEKAWDWITRVFPHQRVWIVPSGQDPFDDDKAEFFLRQGDEVLRVPSPDTTNGWHVRELLAQGDPALRQHLPAGVYSRLVAWGMIRRYA